MGPVPSLLLFVVVGSSAFSKYLTLEAEAKVIYLSDQANDYLKSF